jgi:hypothetical protein
VETEMQKNFEANFIEITVGAVLGVKDKFPGEDGTVETGVWQVKDPYNGTFNLTYEERLEYFES